MSRTLTLFSLLILSYIGWAQQRQFVYGIVLDSTNREEMIGTHVQNLTSGKLTVSDAYGKFRIPAIQGDTLLFTNVGYQLIGWIVEDSWFDGERVEFLLPIDTIFLEEVVIGDFPEYQRFKQLIEETQPEDTSLEVYGVEPVVITGDKRLNEKYVKSPLMALTHPIDFVYQNFSKREKEKRKYHKIQQQKQLVTSAQQKFSRDWVSEMTQLKGDQLTSFIAFCDFKPQYIAETPLYIIHEKMMALLGDFLDQESEG